METTLFETVVVGPNGRIELPSSELDPGSTVKVTVERVSEAKPKLDREAILKRMWELSDKAIADGMETWDIDRVNAEIAERRYGDRERY